jgi:hypothetical protein
MYGYETYWVHLVMSSIPSRGRVSGKKGVRRRQLLLLLDLCVGFCNIPLHMNGAKLHILHPLSCFHASWSLSKVSRVAILAVCCHLPVTILWVLWSCFHQKCISWYYYHINFDSKAEFVHILSTHVLIMAVPWWLDVIHFFILFCPSNLTVPYESRISTLQRTACLCSRPVQTISQYSSWFHC